MIEFTVISLPVFLLLLAYIFRKKVFTYSTKLDFTIYSSILLLIYTTTTFALGFFLVAKHALPKFDWHYLSAYGLVLLLGFHLASKTSVILRYFNIDKQVRLSLQSKNKFFLRSLSALAIVAAGFFSNLNMKNNRYVTVAIQTEELVAANSIPKQFVHQESQKKSLSEYFLDYIAIDENLSMSEIKPNKPFPRPTYRYEKQAESVFQLPKPDLHTVSAKTLPALTRFESTTFGFLDSQKEMSLDDLSLFLHLTYGVTSYEEMARAAPSSSKLYSAEILLLINGVAGIPKGIYHYSPNNHQLNTLRTSDTLSAKLSAYSQFPLLVTQANVVVVFVSDEEKGSYFSPRIGSKRALTLDIGYVARNAQLAADVIKYDSVLIGKFADQNVNQMLGLDGDLRKVRLILPIGVKSENKQRHSLEFQLANTSSDIITYDKENLFSLRTSLSVLNNKLKKYKMEDLANTEAYMPTKKENTVIELPQIKFHKNELSIIQAIQQRRSKRNYSKNAISLRQFSALLQASYSGFSSINDRFVSGLRLQEIWVVVNFVSGLKRGIYRYIPENHAIELMREGDFQQETYYAAVQQEHVKRASAVFMSIVDLNSIGIVDGDRDLSYALMNAGLIGQSLYLQATSLGLGSVAISAFVQKKIDQMLGIRDSSLRSIAMVVVGTL